jgi:hypothetical protein
MREREAKDWLCPYASFPDGCPNYVRECSARNVPFRVYELVNFSIYGIMPVDAAGGVQPTK